MPEKSNGKTTLRNNSLLPQFSQITLQRSH